jgi:prepilin-type N-terminal cleavage/methylation domain-containing protein
MSDLIRKRLTGKEEGFTLIELLVVIVILGILMAIAVPSYMGFKDRANRAAAQANVRSGLTSVEAYYQDNGDYSLMTLAKLKSIDPGIKLDATMTGLSTTSYCVQATVGGTFIYHSGPDHSIMVGACT